MQRFQLVDIVAFALTLAELGQLAFGILLLAQTLFQLVQTLRSPAPARPDGAG
jgi:hypothetical protein